MIHLAFVIHPVWWIIMSSTDSASCSFVNRWASSVGDRSQSWQELHQICKCISPSQSFGNSCYLRSLPPLILPSRCLLLICPLEWCNLHWGIASCSVDNNDWLMQSWMEFSQKSGYPSGVNRSCQIVFPSQIFTHTHIHTEKRKTTHIL